MSGFDGKTRDKATGVTASQIVDGGPVFTPGKVNVMQTYTTGVAYIDKGARCDDSDAPGCFLDAGRRGRLIQLVVDEANVAQTNYKLALEELRVDKLIEKDDDLSWVVRLALDLATSHIASMASKAANRLKSQSISRLENMNVDLMGEDVGELEPANSARYQKIAAALRTVSDKNIEAATKSGFDAAKKAAGKGLKAVHNAAVNDDKQETLSYLEQLKTQCDVGFQDFKRTALAKATDAELVVLLQGLSAEYQTTAMYKAALTEKLARYRKSGVAEIGQKAMSPLEAHVATLYASKRCIWLRDANGSKSLWTYHVISASQDNPWQYGQNPDIEKVPDEFVEAAVARSEEKWGATPTFDNPATKMPLPSLQLHDIPARGKTP